MSCYFSHPWSSCSCGSHNHSVSSPATVSGSVGGTPHCHCGEIAVLRVARTVKNGGKKILGVSSLQGLICDSYFLLG